MAYGIQVPWTPASTASGGLDMGAFAAPAIGAGASIVQGLLGKHAQNKALDAQQAAQQQAIGLQKRQLADQEAVNNYAMKRAQAQENRRSALGTAMLQGIGWGGLQQPSYDMGTINAPPPVLGAPPARGNGMGLGMLGGAPPRPMPPPAMPPPGPVPHPPSTMNLAVLAGQPVRY